MAHFTLYPLLFLSLLSSFATAAVAGNVTTDENGYAKTWVKEPDGRGPWTIVYSTTFTMVLCAWSALHLNVPPPKEKKLVRVSTMVITVVGSLLLPEVVVLNAIGQWRKMRKFQADLQKAATRHAEKVEISGEVTQPSIPTAISTRYAWFAIMGGFVVDISSIHNELEQATLSPSGLLFLAEHGHFCQISDDEIDDKSKADYIAKTLVSFQVLWFVCQVVQRLIARLPLSLLEFHTLVNIGAAMVVYTLWFSKPLNIYTPRLESDSEIDQLVAVLLFQHCIPSHPHQYLRRRLEEEVLHWDSESELWCWTADQEMVLVENLDLSTFVEMAHMATGDDIRILPCTTVGNALTFAVPIESDKYVHTLAKGATAPGQSATTEPRSVAVRNTATQSFELALTAKDIQRLELVRQYIAAAQDKSSSSSTTGEQKMRWKRTHGYDLLMFSPRQRAYHVAELLPAASVIAPESGTRQSATSHHVQAHPPSSAGQVSPSSANTGRDITIDIEMQLSPKSASSPSGKTSEPTSSPRCCPGHAKTNHTPIDELPCFPHSSRAGLLHYSKDWTSSVAHNVEFPFCLESETSSLQAQCPVSKTY